MFLMEFVTSFIEKRKAAVGLGTKSSVTHFLNHSSLRLNIWFRVFSAKYLQIKYRKFIFHYFSLFFIIFHHFINSFSIVFPTFGQLLTSKHFSSILLAHCCCALYNSIIKVVGFLINIYYLYTRKSR